MTCRLLVLNFLEGGRCHCPCSFGDMRSWSPLTQYNPLFQYFYVGSPCTRSRHGSVVTTDCPAGGPWTLTTRAPSRRQWVEWKLECRFRRMWARAEQWVGITGIGMIGERIFCCSRSAHMLWLLSVLHCFPVTVQVLDGYGVSAACCGRVQMCAVSEFLQLPVKRSGDCEWLCVSRRSASFVEVAQQWADSWCRTVSVVYTAEGTLPSC